MDSNVKKIMLLLIVIKRRNEAKLTELPKETPCCGMKPMPHD